MAHDGVLDFGWLAGYLEARGEIRTDPAVRVTTWFPTRYALDLVRMRYGGSARAVRFHGENGFRLVVDGKRAELMLEELAPFFVTRG